MCPIIFRVGGGAASGGGLPDFTTTCTYTLVDDGNGNWRIKLLSSGTFTPGKNMAIDAFLVGGGSSGAKAHSASQFSCRGGNGAYAAVTTVQLVAGTTYNIVIGAGGANSTVQQARNAGGQTSAFGAVANGGGVTDGSYAVAGGNYTQGVNGADGVREFLEASSTTMYCGGGGCGAYFDNPGQGGAGGGANGSYGNDPGNAAANTGGGGGGGHCTSNYSYGNGGSGGSGIVVIRNHREVAA